ncbi:hypothetical protein AS850_00330 [Frondihabitans sp. 762G35]|uniref:hypothetical protein n=1 Tax=Frondihabitans sp. 762G35 TaxID=1446794 RepID=UPI000D21B36D|nr:hypothetical protein [Frondihabitans sp. 762G35]ARC55521.1 hypothetical protein AS850_00330 [Frondihabitans sp. 762G35]
MGKTKGHNPVNKSDYPEVIELVRDLAREHGGIDFDDVLEDISVGGKGELLDLLRRLRQEVFLHSRGAVALVTGRYARVLDMPVPPYIDIVRDSDPRIAPTGPNGAAVEGSAAADVAVAELDDLIHALDNDTGDSAEMTV